jgi:maltose alpha-D-glucosyltransferase / alpha-amylase
MSDTSWHKDAIVYQLHVRTFADSNGDGIGDFQGLIGRLDYLEQLGVTCLWLLPFYESPLRDDGYDISHYERIHPAYGTMADFESFLAEVHRRGLRVITELVINHTSDQHPWFQGARRAPAGSPKRDFYVWSDTAQRYAQARVIFSDAETSNWTWDALPQAYYWHRFFHHQPDLNFDNPHVRQAVLKVMRFWLDKGVDGLRLDAIAHLYEREGTSCDNLPETHALLKWLRHDVDERYGTGSRVLLAEANQPPELLREYFGNGDECHMAFHFPLVARLFAAFADQTAAPIIDIVRRSAAIPLSCQWAVFLRNHDDLSLSALGATENDRLMATYAPDDSMRLHGGIRRRLAPLLGHDPRRIELAHAVLLSLPGTPIIYYGDEIGMSDRLDLNDRDGLRTPMQWNDSRHGGFTSGASATIPANEHTTWGFGRLNVASVVEAPDSLFDRVAAMLRIRREHQAFGRGSVAFPDTRSPSVLALHRRCPGDAVLFVANLSGAPQPSGVVLPRGGLRIFPPPTPESLDRTSQIDLELAPYEWGWWTIPSE